MRTPALRRSVSALLVTSCLTLAAAGAATSAAGTTSATSATPSPDRSGNTPLARLRADAAPRVEVLRASDGDIAALRAADGEPLVPAADGATPTQAASEFVRRYAGALRSSGLAPRTRATGTHQLATDRVVSFQQQVDGLPVVAGELRVVLDADDGLRALSGELTEATTLADATVTELAARRTALAVVARSSGEAEAEGLGLWAYDPTLVGETGPTRPAWRFTVTGTGTGTDGATSSDILIDAATGALLLATSERHALRREVCQGGNAPRKDQIVPCTDPARAEGDPATGSQQVDRAYAAMGRTSDLFARVGVDLTEMIGVGTSGSRVIEAWVNYCPTLQSSACPMDNAYWDGHRIALGEGYANADDVVAHELSHGVIERTADLMYLHQSGAMNESFADIFGELLDQQAPDLEDAEWLVGEALSSGPFRSMASPPLGGQPPKMTSDLYGTHASWYDAGDVHTNSGIGNKTAWLLAHGGSFNGRTVTAIDGDASHERSLQLWYAALLLLTSGSEYADLANALETACDGFAVGGTAGFTAGHCQEVRDAVAATELRLRPAADSAAAREASDACAPGETRQQLFVDDDAHAHDWDRTGYGLTLDGGAAPLWTQEPTGDFGAGDYAVEGTRSWFALDPNPMEFADDNSGKLTLASAEAVTVPPGVRTFLHFHHAWDLDMFEGRFYDGGRVHALTLQDGSWLPAAAPLTWVNGPNRTLQPGAGGTGPAFAGDSRGYGSSRLELTPLAGEQVRPRFSIWADREVHVQGWWVDDIEIYTCATAAPSAVRGLTPTASGSRLTLGWRPPVQHGAGLASYEVTRSDGDVRSVPADQVTTLTYDALPAGNAFQLSVVPVATDGLRGPAVTTTVFRTSLGLTASATRIAKGSALTLTSRLLRAGTTTPVAGVPVIVERRAPGATGWTRVTTRPTGADGRVVLRLAPTATADYRVRFTSRGRWFGSTSAVRRVTVHG